MRTASVVSESGDNKVYCYLDGKHYITSVLPAARDAEIYAKRWIEEGKIR